MENWVFLSGKFWITQRLNVLAYLRSGKQQRQAMHLECWAQIILPVISPLATAAQRVRSYWGSEFIFVCSVWDLFLLNKWDLFLLKARFLPASCWCVLESLVRVPRCVVPFHWYSAGVCGRSQGMPAAGLRPPGRGESQHKSAAF